MTRSADHSDCRLLRRAGPDAPPPAPTVRLDAPTREAYGDFLSMALMRPLWHSAQQHRLSVEQSLNTMSLAERVYLEIEMTQRSQVMYSFEYDPLR